MGCLSSKLLVCDMEQPPTLHNGDFIHHKVSLTSTTYGLLQLPSIQSHQPPNPKQQQAENEEEEEEDLQHHHHLFSPPKLSLSSQPSVIINALDLMKDLIDDDVLIFSTPKNTSKTAHGSPVSKTKRSPAKKSGSRRCPGKENSAIKARENSSRRGEWGRRWPEETEEILKGMERRCPPGGERGVVVYTTTLRGVRKTFEECNRVRGVLESHRVRFSERDVSMDGGYRDELKRLGWWRRSPPVVFVRGRLLGGAEEVVRFEEEGRLTAALWGIPAAEEGTCDRCGGVRFVVCVGCRGSCRKMGLEGRRVRCGECNENGLLRCPLCSSSSSSSSSS